jgi:C-terminal processing protease CtpA/Prc
VVRFIEGEAVVTGYSHADLGPATGLRPGDVILTMDGMPVDSLVQAWRPFYAASNQPTRLRDMARSLSRGEEGPVRVGGTRESGPFEVTVHRVPTEELDLTRERVHDLPGPTFRMLTPEVAYLKLSSVESAKSGEYIEMAGDAEVLVIDIRNYPSEFMVFSLGGHLFSVPTSFARFTGMDPSNPGAFVWGSPVGIRPQEPHFTGKVVILVDEVSQSQAEYTTMAFRASPNALVVGSTTAGADGNVSPIPLPGGLRTLISGIGVFYPDKSPTQRIGIVPDLEVRPTIQGIREGRDEVLEAGVSHALGRPFRVPRG